MQVLELGHAPEHDDSASVIVVEVNSFRDLATSDGQQHRASAIVARLYGVKSTSAC